jgi:putative tricarboxylic transport membrane protein
MVAAFRGSHELKATFVASGGDAAALSVSDLAQLGPDKERVVILTASEPFGRLPGVPTVIQEAQKHHLSAQRIEALSVMAGVMGMGHAFAAPPGVPADRLQALRAAFAKAFKDKKFLARADKAGFYIGYESADKLAESAQLAFKHIDELTPLLKTN